ncbi:hypothetical protein Tco_1011417, partial [Tanacetum coccineum]
VAVDVVTAGILCMALEEVFNTLLPEAYVQVVFLTVDRPPLEAKGTSWSYVVGLAAKCVKGNGKQHSYTFIFLLASSYH